MNKITCLVTALFVSILLNAQAPDVPAESGATFGQATTADKATSLDEALTLVKTQEGKKTDIKVKGTVSSVCEDMGCWITIKSDKSDIMVKMKGHSFFVPLVLKGKEIVIDGVAEEKVTSVDQLKHYAKDAGKSQEQIDAITEPKKEIIVTANGILVL